MLFTFSGLLFAAGIEVQRGIQLNRISQASIEDMNWNDFAWASALVFLGAIVLLDFRYKPLKSDFHRSKQRWMETVEDF